MWVATTQGFYSAVAHRDDPERVIVRGRTREDIEALAKQVPGLEPFEDPDADYRHRAIVTKAEWVVALAELASEIDYDNFKPFSVITDRRVPCPNHSPLPEFTKDLTIRFPQLTNRVDA